MADKHSSKYGKKKKKQKPGYRPEAGTAPVYPTTATPDRREPVKTEPAAAKTFVVTRPVAMPDLTAELKRIGIIGGVLLAVLVAAALLIG
ncbi:hypothetical protein Dehly_0976 [Dehalogenimonas lykanthroporepellens BL-DC-9]|jgi:hypothetical protein|nr:hypothetical protein Dehly_0976 [Dehalogenimonas lykanthroporepellens BL-DC-9]